ncbi:nucleotidyl transferase AbiEii/AbiGii toxin family protein [Gulosibacter sediminis]|uniref:nucleotidyl transferase AbiEii/AbiGii toxin family protein n=1 Tax=Gulosibacter sediminis TaxID=1729695 RepID=UPI0024A82A7C|nr:nucleotidyl transferase AbiEii/AbiGii toxin family protein [Gulosibacter sediminis]
MGNDQAESRLAERVRTLRPKDKQPASAKVLDAWIAQAQNQLGNEVDGGRLGWLIASSVAVAAVQRALDTEGRRLFLLKGGTLLQHRLHSDSRSTKDIDGLIRGDMDTFFAMLEDALDDPWGPLTLRRGEVEIINVPTKLIKPRRFDIYLELRGVTWRRVQFEVSPDEAGIGEEQERVDPPPLDRFGLPDPDGLVGIAMRFQIAQKLHAVSDPHEPPTSVNDRPRDVVDLLLLRDLIAETGNPSIERVRDAAVAVFEARAAEAAQFGLTERRWPPTVPAHDHWRDDYARAAASARFDLSMNDAIAQLNEWIGQVDSASG